MREQAPVYALLAAIGLWLILFFGLFQFQERQEQRKACISSGMTYQMTNEGARCFDDRGNAFLTPFPEKNR